MVRFWFVTLLALSLVAPQKSRADFGLLHLVSSFFSSDVPVSTVAHSMSAAGTMDPRLCASLLASRVREFKVPSPRNVGVAARRLAVEGRLNPGSREFNLGRRIYGNHQSRLDNPNGLVSLIQHSDIKLLSEVIGVDGVAKFLGAAEERLWEILDHRRDLGALVGQNYKSYFINTDSFRGEEIQELRQLLISFASAYFGSMELSSKQLNLLKDSLGTKVDSSTPKSEVWAIWAESNFTFASGKTRVRAALISSLKRIYNLPIKPIDGIQIESEDYWEERIRAWREDIVAAQSDLKLTVQRQSNVSWRTLLRKMRKHLKNSIRGEEYIKSTNEFKLWLSEIEPDERKRNILFDKIRIYFGLLSVADYLPVFTGIEQSNVREFGSVQDSYRESLFWRLKAYTSKVRAFEQGSKYVAAYDLAEFGSAAVVALDDWVTKGADIDELQDVLVKTGEVIAKAYADLKDKIARAIAEYRSRVFRVRFDIEYPRILSQLIEDVVGDDGKIFFPELSQEELAIVAEVNESVTSDSITYEAGDYDVLVRFRASPLVPIKSPWFETVRPEAKLKLIERAVLEAQSLVKEN